MVQKINFSVRAMNLQDLEQALALSGAEGWNQTEKDWRLLLDNPKNICLVAESDKRLIATSTAVSYSRKSSWIGMVLVDSSLRGHGIGKAIFADIIERLRGFNSVKLDATPAGYPLYRKFGFKDERLLYRMINLSQQDFLAEDNDVHPESITRDDMPEIISLDEQIFGAGRNYLIETIRNLYPGKAFCIRRNERITGFILGRDGVKYNYIGPVFAFTIKDAKTLILEALTSLKDRPVALDVPEDKEELAEWLESLGFIRQRQFTRMYMNVNPYPGKPEHQYLIIGPEFG